MKYEYNGNLNIEDRIVNVCNDIKECYPNIPIDKLKKIAVLETPIIDNIVNNKFKFKRLYHILLIINNDKTSYDGMADLVIHARIGDVFNKLK